MSATRTFGEYGGRYVPETLIPALDELEQAWESLRDDAAFQTELDELRKTYAGRPTPITRAPRFAPDQRVYLKREDLMHTGAHKLNNALGQVLIAQRLGKRRIIAETGAGQHGVATATVCARFGLECIVYMGSRTSAARRRTSSGWASSARRCAPSSSARGRSRRRRARQSATGSRTWRRRTT